MISGGSDAVRHMGVIAHLHICVGSARCSSYYDGHMPEPLTVGRAMVRYPRFFCIPVRLRVSAGQKHQSKQTMSERQSFTFFKRLLIVLAVSFSSLTGYCALDLTTLGLDFDLKNIKSGEFGSVEI